MTITYKKKDNEAAKVTFFKHVNKIISIYLLNIFQWISISLRRKPKILAIVTGLHKIKHFQLTCCTGHDSVCSCHDGFLYDLGMSEAVPVPRPLHLLLFYPESASTILYLRYGWLLITQVKT